MVRSPSARAASTYSFSRTRQRLRPHDAGVGHPLADAEHEDDVHHPGPEDDEEHDGEQDEGEGELDVAEPHDDVVDPAAEIAGQRARPRRRSCRPRRWRRCPPAARCARRRAGARARPGPARRCRGGKAGRCGRRSISGSASAEMMSCRLGSSGAIHGPKMRGERRTTAGRAAPAPATWPAACCAGRHWRRTAGGIRRACAEGWLCDDSMTGVVSAMCRPH